MGVGEGADGFGVGVVAGVGVGTGVGDEGVVGVGVGGVAVGVGVGAGLGVGMGLYVVDNVVEVAVRLPMGMGEGGSAGIGDGVGIGEGDGTGVGVGGVSPVAIATAARDLTCFVSVFTTGALLVSTAPTAETAEVSSPVWNNFFNWPAAASEETAEAPTFLNSKPSFALVDCNLRPPCAACVRIVILRVRLLGSWSMFLT